MEDKHIIWVIILIILFNTWFGGVSSWNYGYDELAYEDYHENYYEDYIDDESETKDIEYYAKKYGNKK